MRKIQLIVLLLISATYFQSCKKDATTSATTTSDKILAANINGTSWYPDTVSAKINFDDATKIKTFSVTGTFNAKRVTFNLNVPNSTSANNFPVASYRVDATNKLTMAYFEQQKDPGTGSLVFVQKGTVEPGSGTVTISSIDSAKKVITGTFSFTAKKVNTDPVTGDIVSIDIYQVLIGSFTNLPYLLNNND